MGAKSVKRKKAPPKKKKINIGKILLVFITTCISLCLILYPYISNYLFENRADGIVSAVEAQSESAEDNQYDDDIEAAKAYNENLVTGKIKLKDPFDENAEDEDTKEYKSLLNMTEDGVMGFIKIPSIDVSLPIYHGTSEETLEKGAGHLQGTSLPIGGPSTHTVITGHTGLSSAKLFTDLIELEEGDIFFLNVMGEKMAYKIDQIQKVLPKDIDSLTIEDGKDYCTLVTCTPYGVNTHRLLVRGVRTDYQEATEEPSNFEVKKTQSKWQEEYAKSIIIAASAFLAMMALLLTFRYLMNKREEKKRRKRRHKRKKRRPTPQNKPPSGKTHSGPPGNKNGKKSAKKES